MEPEFGRVPCLKMPFSGEAGETQHRHFPSWEPGDRLWVREAFAQVGSLDPGYLVFRATYPDEVPPQCDNVPSEEAVKWRPSIHMPRWASRITLEILSVRVERLQEISEDDAWKEGCARGEPTDNGGFFPAYEPDPSGIGERGWDCAQDWFADLWDSIAKPEFKWSTNCWVWVIEFKRV